MCQFFFKETDTATSESDSEEFDALFSMNAALKMANTTRTPLVLIIDGLDEVSESLDLLLI